MQSLKQNIAWNTFGSFIYLICLWLTTVLVVILSPNYENSGYLALGMAAGNIYTGIATYNIRTYQVSDIDNKFSSQNYVAFRCLTASSAYLVCAIVVFITAKDYQMLFAVLIFLLYKADEAFVNVFYGIDQKASRIDIVGKSQLIRGIVVLFLFCAILLCTKNILLTFFAMFVGCVIITIIYDIPQARKFAPLRPLITKKECIELLKECFPVVLSLFCYASVASFTRQWFGIQFGEEALGIYAAIATPCALVQSLCSYLYQPLLTTFSEYWNAGNFIYIRKLLGKITGLFIVVLALCLLAAQISGDYVLQLIYGAEISSYTWLLIPALIASSLMASSFFVTDILTCFRKLQRVLMINATSMIVALLSMNLLMQYFYMNGISITIIVSFAMSTLIGLFFLCQMLRD